MRNDSNLTEMEFLIEADHYRSPRDRKIIAIQHQSVEKKKKKRSRKQDEPFEWRPVTMRFIFHRRGGCYNLARIVSFQHLRLAFRPHFQGNFDSFGLDFLHRRQQFLWIDKKTQLTNKWNRFHIFLSIFFKKENNEKNVIGNDVDSTM